MGASQEDPTGQERPYEQFQILDRARFEEAEEDNGEVGIKWLKQKRESY